MWIFFNDGILKLKIPVLTTYLRTMWKVAREGHPLSREKLVEGRQKIDNLSAHLTKAISAGLIFKIRGKVYPMNGNFISDPNEYLPLNSTHKVCIKDCNEINDAFSYALLKEFGYQHSPYYIDKYDAMAPTNISIECVAAEDFSNHRLADSLDTPQLPVQRVINISKQRY